MFPVTEPSDDAIKAMALAQKVYTKRLRSPHDLGDWKRSRAYYDLVAYINNSSMAIQGHRQSGGDFVITEQMQKLCKMFDWLDRLVCEYHPMGIGTGLGVNCLLDDQLDATESSNSLRHKCQLAFRHWLQHVQEQIFGILERQLRPHCKHINELAQYLTRSFGSIKTNVYGPGNELMFVFFLCALFKCGILLGDDTVAAALLLYQRYLQLVRRILLFYRLSSFRTDSNAIDERNVLPYVWGSAQLCRNAPFTPLQCQEPAILELHRRDFMLLSSLDYLQRSMQNEPLGVHSHQLWCVLSLSQWPDVYAALMGTFVKHVLDDYYVVQHLIFSDIMSFDRQPAEFLQLAYLGEKMLKPRSQRGSNSSQSNDELGAVENDLDVDDANVGTPPLPVSRHNSLNTQVFLGFRKPRKQSDFDDDEDEDDLDDDDDDDDVGFQLLRRPRKYRNSYIGAQPRTSSLLLSLRTNSTSHAMDSNRDTHEISEMLQFKKSVARRDSSTSYYSI